MFTDCYTLAKYPRRAPGAGDVGRPDAVPARGAVPRAVQRREPHQGQLLHLLRGRHPRRQQANCKVCTYFLPVTIPLSPLVRQSSAVVTGRKYKGFRKDGTGFRVYNAWWQHRRENKIRNDPRVVVQHATDAPIRPHHRSGIHRGAPEYRFMIRRIRI